MNDVSKFLQQFQSSNDIDEVFANKCSYWSALILFWRFIKCGSKIMYDKTARHFGTEINGRVYDITGDVTDKYVWVAWDSIPEGEERNEIINANINF